MTISLSLSQKSRIYGVSNINRLTANSNNSSDIINDVKK